MKKLKYLDMVINETSRYYPPVLLTDRVCSKKYQLPEPAKGYPGYKVEMGYDVDAVHGRVASRSKIFCGSGQI